MTSSQVFGSGSLASWFEADTVQRAHKLNPVGGSRRSGLRPCPPTRPRQWRCAPWRPWSLPTTSPAVEWRAVQDAILAADALGQDFLGQAGGHPPTAGGVG